MLEHKVFAEGVAKDIKEYLPPDYADVECTVMEKSKNNGTVMVGLALRKPDVQVTSVLYVEPYYEEICQGKPIGEVMEKIADTAQEVMERNQFIDLPDIKDYENAKEYLEVKIINTRANRRELKGLVHRENEDLSLIPFLKFPLPEQDVTGSVKVSHELMDCWNVSADMVMDQAWQNTRQKEPPTLKGLVDMLSEVTIGNPIAGNLLTETEPMQEGRKEMAYVLSNTSGVFGAAYLTCPETMEKISGLFPEGFYLLPSSVHEIIVVPKDKDRPEQGKNLKELGEMVRAVNRTSIEKEEILSDRIYEYDKKSEKIRQVPESIKRERGMER